MSVSVSIKGNAFSFFKKAPKEFELAADRALSRYAHEVARQMKRDAPKAHSLLATSIKPDRFNAFHYRVGPHVAYAEAVEKGLDSGRWVDKQSLIDWVKVKGLAKGSNVKSTAFLIRRKIYNFGTDAQPFVAPFAKSKKWQKRLNVLLKTEFNRV